MKKISVFQCETNDYITLELVGIVRYIGESFWAGDGFTNGKNYSVVRDKNNYLKVVDDSDEDYIWDLRNPKPSDESSKGGKFELVEDYTGELTKIYNQN